VSHKKKILRQSEQGARCTVQKTKTVMFADFELSSKSLDTLPEWHDDDIPETLSPWTRTSYVHERGGSNHKIYHRGKILGQGTAGKVFLLEPSMAIKEFRSQFDFEDEKKITRDVGIKVGLVEGQNAIVMSRGVDLTCFLMQHTMTRSEVMFMLDRILQIQEWLIAERCMVYSDIKCANVLLFKSPEQGCARVTFCDYGGIVNIGGGQGVCTFPPPELHYNGYLYVYTASQALAASRWWCGVLFLEMYQMLEMKYFLFIINKDKEPSFEEREKHLVDLRKILVNMKANCIACALAFNPENRVW
jgi:hypothetical protein